MFSLSKLFELAIVFIKTAFIEYYEFILLAAGHFYGCDRKDDPLPRNLTYFTHWQNEMLILSVYSKLVGSVGDSVIFDIKTTTEYSVIAYYATYE